MLAKGFIIFVHLPRTWSIIFIQRTEIFRDLPRAIEDSPRRARGITTRAPIYTCLLFNKNVIVVSEETRIVQ